jgi:predicted ATP-grasp superfamily ATP-dependent carboligase
MDGPVAVVLGLRENGLGMVRALGRRGVPVIAVDDRLDRIYARTRYARGVVCKDLHGSGLIDGLCEIGKGLDRKGVLVPTMDQNVRILSEHRDRLETYFRHSMPAPEVVDVLMDKGATREYAESHGFLMPRSFEIAAVQELESCLEQIEAPYILKPQHKTVAFFRYAPKKVVFTRSKDELRQAFGQMMQWEPGVVLQEWVPGGDDNLVFGLYYFDESSDPVGAFTGRKIRQYIPYCGTGCSAEPWSDGFLLEHGPRFFKEIGYRGFAAIEFKISDRDGKYYLVEPSIGRTEHLFALAAANNVNLPYIGYRHMLGLPPEEQQPPTTPVRYLNWKNDRRAAWTYIRDGELTAGAWLRSLGGPKQFALFARDDAGPFLAQCMQPLVRLPRGAARRISRKIAAFREGRIAAPKSGPGNPVHDTRVHIEGALDWLCRAQDAVPGGGVARGYGTVKQVTFPLGWQPAYPETTGYIIPTFFNAARYCDRPDLEERALRMARWETEVQSPDGSIPGGVLGEGKGPVVFNTGQVILGWCRAYEESNDPAYRDALTRAGDFLVEVQDRDGGWRRFSSGDGVNTVHAYDVRVAWALLRAHEIVKKDSYRETATRNVDFTLGLQQPNGWFRSNDLQPKTNGQPLTHTIAYATRGILESGMLLSNDAYIESARKTADAVLDRLGEDGRLAGRLDHEWKDAVSWCCLTGSAQMSIIWLKLYRLTGDERYRDAGIRINRYLKAAQDLIHDDEGVRGGIAGSFPLSTGYNRFQILNWATKFFVDALMLEDALVGEE